MSRIARVEAGLRRPLLAVVYAIARRKTAAMAGRAPERAIEPIELFAHSQSLMLGYLALEGATVRQRRVDERLKALAETKVAAVVRCEYCIDIASSISRAVGLSDEQLLALPRYRESQLFNELEKLVLEYAEAMTRTPADVPARMFDSLRHHFDDAQLVELTSVIALENMRSRFNLALDIGAPGFSDGAVCVAAEGGAAAAEVAVPSEGSAGAQVQ